jgi:hypothetical protein
MRNIGSYTMVAGGMLALWILARFALALSALSGS